MGKAPGAEASPTGALTYLCPVKREHDTAFALLIDGDNAAPRRLALILEEVSKEGTITIRRIYGDWTSQGMSGWKEQLNAHAIQPVQQFAYTKGKNSTDSALIIDAMDILHAGRVDAFCIVSSDSDYTRLATRLREAGLYVMGVGEKKTPDAFVQACERFIYVENLADPEEGKGAPRPARKKDVALSANKGLMRLLRRAFNMAKDEEDEAFLSSLGNALRRLDPGFDPRTYGHTSLSGLINALGDRMETRRDKKTDALIVRFKGR